MILTAPQLITELSTVVDSSLANAVVENYVEMQKRFLAGDWKPAELDGGRFCEAVARCIHQLDAGTVTHAKLPGKICERLEDETVAHILNVKDRHHVAKVISVLYKFRSDRGAVHISPIYTANEMDSILVLHSAKWLFAEFLRLAWKKDLNTIAETIARIIQLEHSLIHELDRKPLVLAKGISAQNEVLLLLNHAAGNRLSRSTLRALTTHQTNNAVNVALSNLLKNKEVRETDDGEIALTPLGQKRIIEEIIPKLNPYK